MVARTDVREHERGCVRKLRELGITQHKIDEDGRNYKLRFTHQGKPQTHIYPKSPGDWRTLKNCRSEFLAIFGDILTVFATESGQLWIIFDKSLCRKMNLTPDDRVMVEGDLSGLQIRKVFAGMPGGTKLDWYSKTKESLKTAVGHTKVGIPAKTKVPMHPLCARLEDGVLTTDPLPRDFTPGALPSRPTANGMADKHANGHANNHANGATSRRNGHNTGHDFAGHDSRKGKGRAVAAIIDDAMFPKKLEDTKRIRADVETIIGMANELVEKYPFLRWRVREDGRLSAAAEIDYANPATT